MSQAYLALLVIPVVIIGISLVIYAIPGKKAGGGR